MSPFSPGSPFCPTSPGCTISPFSPFVPLSPWGLGDPGSPSSPFSPRNYGKQGDWLFEIGTHSVERSHLINTLTFQVLLSTKLSDVVHKIHGSILHHNVQIPINIFWISVIIGGGTSIIC